MEKLFYISLAILCMVWTFRFFRVKRSLKPEYFLNPLSYRTAGKMPFVSVLIPARNEEKNIARCINSLLKQTYSDYEIIVVNDRSTDNTANVVSEIAACHQNVTLINIKQCPEGWSGKNHALHNGVQRARGDFLVFTDADTYHEPECIETALAYSVQNSVDLLSVNPHLVTASFWENVIMPIAGAVLMVWYPIEKINSQDSRCSYANGQFIMMRKDAYVKIDGHQSVREALLEDLALARRIKDNGLRLRALWGPKLYKTHMYTSLRDIWRGWVRIFYHGLEKNIVKMGVSVVLIILFSLSPYLLLMWSLLSLAPMHLAWAVALMIYIYSIIMYAYTASNSNRIYVISHLLGCIVVMFILIHSSLTVILKKQITWRGISYPT
ncbi:MAG: glycosyltransferase [Candidatus Auribacter fodinae]|jgi:chlorobactene glucosyltransferase|uniref:Glycosyltransferase n=1 Tax=Candidatus Auribacter fodinae TaxID=2093366 RepID=A0A3A4QVM2_9BACT|nr:MAG: glycosyltransferase [Candidatus Auribacter fodinae]